MRDEFTKMWRDVVDKVQSQICSSILDYRLRICFMADDASFHEPVSGMFNREKRCFDKLVEMLHGIPKKIEIVRISVMKIEPTERGTTGEKKYAAADGCERLENPILKGIQALLVEFFVAAHNAPLALSATGVRWFRW